MHVPVLETSRLTLRGHRYEDFSSSAAMWADPLVTKFIGGVPSTEQVAWNRFLAYKGLWEIMGHGYWFIEEKGTGRFVGECGLAHFKRDMETSVKDLPEAGWVLRPEFHGKGYAHEAVSAMLEWGKSHLKEKRRFCIIDAENAPSIRLAEKLGFQFQERAPYKGEPINVYLLSGEEATGP